MTDKYSELQSSTAIRSALGNYRPEDELGFTNNNVKHPKHYQYKGFEVLDVVKQLPFVEGNIVKYVMRYKSKNGLEDLKKAQYYLNYLIDNYKE